MRRFDSAAFWARSTPEPTTGCWLWFGTLRRDGYGELKVHGQRQRAHRVAWVITNGPVPDGLVVRHKCDNPICINPDHLAVGTHADNRQDTVSRERHAFGRKNGRAKLTEEQVATIKVRLASQRISDIAREFGVSRRAVTFIRDGVNWRRVSKGQHDGRS